MSMTEADLKLTGKFRFHRRALGVSSILLLVTGAANFFGWIAPSQVPESLLNSIQYLLVAMVILLALGLQRSGNALQRKAQERREAVAEGDDDFSIPVPPLPSGPEYTKARKKATIFQVTAIAIIAGSFIVVPTVGNLIISSGAPFEAFNAFMIGVGVLLLAAAAASKYFTNKARDAGRQSVSVQEEHFS